MIMLRVHGTTVAIDGRGVLLRGPSGAGKSDLALRLIDQGALLVADDQTELTVENDRVTARAPATIAGRIEVRGLGIIQMRHADHAPLLLLVDLVAPDRVERLPAEGTETLLDHAVRRVALAPFEASAPAKVRLAVDRAYGE
jgi:serine kinase of HPr protein (carbohydrate metabolism regulator)